MKNLAFVILLSIFFQACSLGDKDSFEPAYLEIPSANLTTTPAQGSNSHQIEDMWVTADEINLGVFPLPANIPIIIKNAETKIRITAGVKPNGSNNESISYPFYEAIELNLPLEEGDLETYVPNFVYRSDAKFDIIEDFEGAIVLNKDLDGDFSTGIVRSSEESNGGNSSGLIALNSDAKVAEFTTQAQFSKANNAGGATYVEFDYLTNVNIYVGYLLQTDFGPVQDYEALFVPNNEWKRAYIDLTDKLTASDVQAYQVIFYIETEGGNSKTYLDNLKLVHF